MIDVPEVDLVARAQRGEVNAIGALYDQHHESIFRYMWLRLADPELAEDLTSDVFLRMLDALPRYQAQGIPFRAWLYRIAHNLVVDYFRRTNQHMPLALKAVDDQYAEDDPGATIEQTLLAERVQAALTQLEPSQCEVVTLRFLLGLSLQETALVVGKSEAAIKSLQHRGLGALRRALKPLKESMTS